MIEVDYSSDMSIISKLLQYFVFRLDSNKTNDYLENDADFQDIVKYKRDELPLENILQLNTNVKIKMELLRFSMLTHRWSIATEVLSALFLEIGRNAPPICQLVRVGLELKSQLSRSGILDSFIESAIATSTNDALTIEIDRFLYEVTLKFEHGILVGIKNSAASLEDLAVNLRNARHNSTGRRIKNVEIARKTHIDKLYTGAISYIQAILSNAELLKIQKEDFADEAMEEMQEENHFHIVKLQDDIKAHVNTADSYFQEALRLCPSGPWDSFISMYIDLLRRFHHIVADYKDTIRQILETFCEANLLNKNAWKMLAEFYVSSKLDSEAEEGDDDVEGRGLEILEKICELDCFDETCLLLVQSGLSKSPSVSYLFKMLDGFQWKNNEEVWLLLVKELIKLLTSDLPDDKLQVEKEWKCRSTWWPKYHFFADTKNVNNVDFLKAAVAGILLRKKNKFFKYFWKEKSACMNRDFQHLLIIAFNLNNKVQIDNHPTDTDSEDDFEFISYTSDVIVL